MRKFNRRNILPTNNSRTTVHVSVHNSLLELLMTWLTSTGYHRSEIVAQWSHRSGFDPKDHQSGYAQQRLTGVSGPHASKPPEWVCSTEYHQSGIVCQITTGVG